MAENSKKKKKSHLDTTVIVTRTEFFAFMQYCYEL